MKKHFVNPMALNTLVQKEKVALKVATFSIQLKLH